MARPDERVLMNVDGYQFKKAKKANHVFVTTPEGVNVTLDAKVLQQFIASLESDENTKKQFGL
ncbi:MULTISPECIES: hypothetical protein [Geomicrobium]|uniref:AbrB family transcriptional regulator n=1 Tax=Geomicrobium sediminis TaxID=1347788 RepID=A0ABS2PBK7_9BACL|nr:MULTISPECIES: hypothetical protein [Geomicrobium]MBM7632726.1 hypothetical protein [Geomicrobium sediminis]GAK00521.1 hypothetical protein JCM19055_3614 [Geomicrobium sp. JCM 19055]GAK09083.1 hypothetical protein JCM19038_2901 [Geomicrobium sp. JCM 19038]